MSKEIFKPIDSQVVPKKPLIKISVVGVGAVGMAAAFSIMVKGIANEICLIDVMTDRVKGEVMDMQHGQQFVDYCTIKGGSDYELSKDSDIVVITAGARQAEGESRLNLVQRNVEIFKKIIPLIVKNSPNAILVVVSNPVDLQTYVTWKLSGLPKHRVIGTGTMLDSARFRFFVGEKLGLAPNALNAYIIGEHGDSSVPVWSNVSVAGVPLASKNPAIGSESDPENFGQLHKDVVNGAYEIIKLKGYTSWAIGLTCADLCDAIINDRKEVHPLSTFAKGYFGINQDICLSLPCVVSSAGITHIVPQLLSDSEIQKLNQSAAALDEIAKNLNCQ